MTFNKDKYIEVIAELIKLTENKKIKWESYPVNISYNDVKISMKFRTEYLGKKINIYTKHILIVEPPNPMLTIKLFPIRKEYPYWSTETVLEFVDDLGNSIWKFPEIPILFDLLEVVKQQVAGVSDFINNLFNKEGGGMKISNLKKEITGIGKSWNNFQKKKEMIDAITSEFIINDIGRLVREKLTPLNDNDIGDVTRGIIEGIVIDIVKTIEIKENENNFTVNFNDELLDRILANIPPQILNKI